MSTFYDPSYIPQPSAQVRLLVIDESPWYYGVLEQHAEMCEHEFRIECSYAESSAKALDLVATWNPSVVLIDAHLCESNVFSLLAELVQQAVAGIVMTSDASSVEIEKSALEYGADGYMPKVSDPDDLDHVLRYLTSLSTVLPHEH